MDRTWLNEATKLEFRDPVPFLARLRELEPKVAMSALSTNARSLRTNSLKAWRQLREAAIFCVGVGARMGQKVYLAKSESLDYDFVASWVSEDARHFAPVQLKEVVPHEVNPASSVQGAIDALPGKYVDSKDLTIAVYLNRAVRFDPVALHIPPMGVAALWVFGGLCEGDSQWGLWGDFFDGPKGTRFTCQA